MTPLRQRMIEKLQLKNYSTKTQQMYVAAVSHFARYFRRSPDQLGPEEVHEWQLHLRDQAHVSWSAFNVNMCALRFFYRHVLERDDMIPRLSFMRTEKPLPVVPSPEEVCRFLDAIDDDHYRMVLSVAYGCGLRLQEATRLELRDIDSQRMVLHVRKGKGNKDRYVTLSPILLEVLREYWRRYRPGRLLFPSPRDPEKPLNPTTLQKTCKKICEKAGLAKKLTPHSLRHAFATHLVENGTDLSIVQALLGHTNIRTTQIYARISNKTIRAVISPFDRLPPSRR
jgi:site-specific recombinase XerD